jgi:hypothetical protein
MMSELLEAKSIDARSPYLRWLSYIEGYFMLSKIDSVLLHDAGISDTTFILVVVFVVITRWCFLVWLANKALNKTDPANVWKVVEALSKMVKRPRKKK